MPYLGNIPSPIILQDVLGNYNFDYGTLYIDSVNNRVGIGTSSPSYTLDVNGSARSNYILFGSNTTAPTADAAIYRPADGTLGLVTGSTERMRITSAGNVGIGTSSPDTILDARKTNASYWGQTTTNTWGGTLTPPQALAITNSQPNGYDPVLLFRQATSTGTIKTSGAIGLVGGSNWIDGNDATQYSNMYFAIRNTTGGLQEIMRFTVDGRVGIGTTTPSSTLQVNGSLSKSSGSFNIPHPLPELSETHRLIHSFVEAPTADNIYRGRLQLENGQATVNIDTHVGMTEGTFSALNGNIQVFLQNDSGWDLVRGSVTDNILTIISQNQQSTDTISWMVIGERQDQHMLDTQWTDEFGRPILEPLKEPEPEIQLPPELEVPNENG